MSRTRSLEIWHIPKRQNVHQIIGAIEILAQDKFNGKSWTGGKKESFNTELGKQGLTKNGRPLAQSARRTLEALLKYLGFIFVDHTTTPETINVTNAGLELIKKHGSILGKRKNLVLVRRNDEEIFESPLVQTQMTKLQLTNPVIREDCINILLFPFRVTLKLLLALEYLTKEEIGYILFGMKKEDEYNLILEKIKTFRLLPDERKNAEIEAFKNTEIGNITLVQAPTTTYYMGLCIGTGLCVRENDKLYIREDKATEAENITNKFKGVEPFDFGDNLKLWIEYFGNTQRWLPPTLVRISNKNKGHLLVRVYDLHGSEIERVVIQNNEVYIPLFMNEKYKFQFFDFKNASKVLEDIIEVNNEKLLFDVPVANQSSEPFQMSDLIEKVKDLINSKGFDADYQKHIENVKEVTGKDNFNVAQLRGGRLEYLFFQLLNHLKEKGIIDEVIWHGRVDEYGVSYPALGGKEGDPDIHFYVGKYLVVLELTTIKSNAMQWTNEAASVHDHITNLLKKTTTNHKTIGIFSAPLIGNRTENMFKHITTKEGVLHKTVSVEDLLEVLEKDREGIINFIEE